jgi:hypothetical protein
MVESSMNKKFVSLTLALILLLGLPSRGFSENAAEETVKSVDVVNAVHLELASAEEADARGSLARPQDNGPSVSSKISDFFSVKDLSCVSNARISCVEIQKRLKTAGALSLWSLNKESVKKFSFLKFGSKVSSFNVNQLESGSLVRDILTENPWIEDAEIDYSTSGRSATVTIREAVPWFVTELRKSNWVVSRRGALLQEVNSITDPNVSFEVAQLPRVRGIEGHSARAVAREAAAIRTMAQFLGVVNSMSGMPFEVESYELLEDESVAISPLSSTLPTVFVRGETTEDTHSKLELLKRVLGDSKSRGESLQRVDLRFKGRAVVVKTPETSPLPKVGKLS